jgi:hypothetical protein
MKILYTIIFAALSLSLFGCKTFQAKEDYSPKMYSERPLSILVLPPVNKTTAADSKEYYATTVAQPLTNSGYYVFPMEVVYDILQQEGLSDAETMSNIPPQKFREFFGNDAVLYVSILKWNTSYVVVSGSVTVQAECELKSSITGETLWAYNEEVTVSTEGSNYGSGGWVGLIAKVVSTAIQTATQDYVPLATTANEKIFATLPYGKYHKRFDHDKKDRIEVKKLSNQQKTQNANQTSDNVKSAPVK